MRLTEVNIDQFGVWRDIGVPLNDSGVNVFYGPNEAGKSTLMRFVRGVLYGFRPQADGAGYSVGPKGEAHGSLRIINNGGEHVIRREAEAGKRGRARFDDLDWGGASDARIRQVVRDTTESLYENVFAVGLAELQELATLDADEVAEHIYGLSLGPEGERILRARSAFEKQRRNLLSDDRKAGELVRLASRLQDLDRELSELGDASERHQLLRADKDRLNSEIDTSEKRRADCEYQLRGHRFMDRVYTPWKRERQLRGEREALSLPHGFPEDGLSQFDELVRELKEQQSRRDHLMKEAERLDDEADEMIGDSESMRHEMTIRRLSETRDDLNHRERRLKEKQSRIESLEQKLRTRLADLGNGWSIDKLTQHPMPSSGVNRLWDAARRYHTAASQRSRTVRRYKKAVASTQRRQAEFNERIKSLGGKSLPESIRTVQRRLSDLRELSRLRLEEAQLLGQAVAASGTFGARGPVRDLPPLYYFLMVFFAGAGIVLAILGGWGAWSSSVAGGNTAWIVGLIYFCFGLCMAGTSWTVKQHLEQYFQTPLADDPSGTERVAARDPHASRSLERVRQSIRDLVGTAESQPRSIRLMRDPTESTDDIDESDVIVRTAERLTDLQSLEEEERQIQQRRHRLSRYRELLRDRQRFVSQRRREWCDTLRDLGIGETLKVEQAVELWAAIQEAQSLLRPIALLQDDLAVDRRSVDELRRQMERLIGELPNEAVAGLKSEPDQIIARWGSLPPKRDDSREKRTALRQSARAKRREADSIEVAIRDLDARRHALLVQTGSSSRDELAVRTQSLARHRELSRRIDEAQAELQAAAEAEPTLAIVEEDLLAFDAAVNKQSIQRLEQELKQLNHDVQAAHQELGRIERELQELANDRRAVSLRFEREQIATQLSRETEAWCSLDMSIEAIDHVRHRMERYAQSQTLQLASQYLDRLTCGKYPNVWSPLGERNLCIDDDSEQTLRVEQLSTGTREQLFLAIRLAMIRRFAEEGVELPMVLDDVFVNFDQVRTEAAVETILDFADQGHQILLFTCHLHLAHMFESKGVDPVWLPNNAAAVEKRRAG